jgi:hypothetical protein
MGRSSAAPLQVLAESLLAGLFDKQNLDPIFFLHFVVAMQTVCAVHAV